MRQLIALAILLLLPLGAQAEPKKITSKEEAVKSNVESCKASGHKRGDDPDSISSFCNCMGQVLSDNWTIGDFEIYEKAEAENKDVSELKPYKRIEQKLSACKEGERKMASSDQDEIAAIASTLKAPIPQESLQAAQYADQNREQVFKAKDVSQLQEWSTPMTRVNAIVQGIGGKMWTARILDSPQVNARTAGGPYFYIYTGILPYFRTSNDTLALMIAHEMSHVLLKHVYQKQMRNREEGKDKTTPAGKMANAAFTRDQEEQADALATILCFQHGYDPEQGKEFFVQLAFEREIPEALKNAAGDAMLRGLKDLAKPDPLDCLFDKPKCERYEQAQKNIEAQQTARQRQRQETQWALDHPANPNRALAVTALTRHLRGSGSLDDVRKYHQTYIVLEAYRAMQATQK